MIQIRPYRPADYQNLKRLYLSSNTFGGQFDEDRDSQEKVDEQIALDSNSVLVAEDNGKILGSVSILRDKRFAWLMRFAVVVEFEKQISELLFKKAAEILKEAGHTQVLVYSPSTDGKFKERYEDFGFTAGESCTAYWRFLE
jgi:predicted N-acetyltransferase YhbS